jgi:cation diffusion facilitator CzcD-associated flavoprotein CzcO
MSDPRYCVVGAGPGGLAMARAFRNVGITCDVYEALPTLGGIWDISNKQSPLYERTRLVSPARLSGFTGFPMPASYPDYPSHQQVLAYLHSFADHYCLHGALRLSSRVCQVRPTGRGYQVSLADGRSLAYSGVVLACGHNWQPNLPRWAGELGHAARHSSRYRNPEPFAGRSVLVVGGGNSACDIACDLVGTASQVTLSLRRGYFFLPRYVQGRPTAEWARSPEFSERKLGLILAQQVRRLAPFAVPAPSHQLFESNPVINDEIVDRIAGGDITVRPNVAGTDGGAVVFVDGSRQAFDAVILGTGYQCALPVLGPLSQWRGGRPALPANMFHPTHDRVFVLGLFETDASAFPLLSAQADLVAQLVAAVRSGADAAGLHRLVRRSADADLSGGRRFVDSARHAISVHSQVYLEHLATLSDRLAGR